LWDKALKSRKLKIVREAEAEGEVIKKDKMFQAKEKFLQLKLSMNGRSMTGTNALLPLRISLNSSRLLQSAAT
jgi:hypothetical protein